MVQAQDVTIKKILYATDLSENARYVFTYAVSLAIKYFASITMLHVVHEIPDFADRSMANYIDGDRWEQIKKRHLEDARQGLIEGALMGSTATRVVRRSKNRFW